jgi:ATP-dependent Clp protease ATP-binding subunit ClpC
MQLDTNQPTPPAADLIRSLEEAESIAEGVGQPTNTAHVLLALFTVPSPAAVLLRDKSIDEDLLLELLPAGSSEHRGSIRTLLRLAEESALRCDAKQINTLHLLVAILKYKETIAHRLIEQALGNLSPFRNQLLSFLTGVLPRRLLMPIHQARDELRRPEIPSRLVKQNPDDNWVVPKNVMDSAPPLASRAPHQEPFDDENPSIEAQDVNEAHDSMFESEIPDADLDSAVSIEPIEYEDVDVSTNERHAPISRAPTLLPTAYDLDPQDFPWLTSLGRNLSALAHHSALDPAVGRSREIEQIIDVLGKRRANNPCLVGDPGVGKTAIAEGLAVKLVRGDDDVSPLLGKVIIELDMGRITAGTSLRGSFSERMQGLKKDVERAKGRAIVFIDEIHTLMGAGASGDSPQDAANELKAALARGAFPCIGSTTQEEYRKYIEADPALERRFVRISIEEPTEQEATEIIGGIAPLYEQHHGIQISETAISASIQLASRFIHDRKLPGKAIDLLDLAMSRARRSGVTIVRREEIARVCADVTRVPLERVLLEDTTRFLQMESFLERRVIGHQDIIATIAETIRRNYAGFSTQRPMGGFLFLGPSGVGKTELAKTLADFLYGTKNALITVDMTEYTESHSLSRLVGAPPGYVGHQEGGQLTEAIRRRPHAVVLLDEIEKAHPDILPVLLQILDEGRVTDSKGKRVTFRHAIIIMTSNLGAGDIRKRRVLGFSGSGSDKRLKAQAVLESAQKFFVPELWNRIEEKLVFGFLDREQLKSIARLFCKESERTLSMTRNIVLKYEDDVLEFLIDKGHFDEASGARPMRQTVQKMLETPIADAILRKQIQEGDRIRLKVQAGHLTLHRIQTSPS